MTSKEDIIVNSFIFVSSVILIFITIYYFCSQTNTNRNINANTNRNRHISILYPPPYGPILEERTPRYEINYDEDKPPDYQEIYNNITNV
jgi:hypothetical protein